MKLNWIIRWPLAIIAPLALGACVTYSNPYALREYDPKPEHVANVSLAELVDEVDIPFESFTLDNGLTTIVHTDRKAPIVGVTVYYGVGSRHEPRGRAGFAHLFEHIMFGGSENVESFDVAMEAVGSTPTNGSTSYDRTNYVQTVPTGALDLALFLESDRMGHLLGAVTQERLDRQRSVVQNEKRENDIEPFGLVDYLMNERLLPAGHPYRHSIVGSMADLDAASLEDVHSWFTQNYGPNNVVLTLAGDIDVETARIAVERWFGDIPRGPDIVERPSGPVDLAAPIREEITDSVTQTRLYRSWTGPGLNHPDAVPLEVGMHILGGLYSSRLDGALVNAENMASSVYAYARITQELSFLTAIANVPPSSDRDLVEAAFIAEIDRLVEEGPTAEEIQRAATEIISGQISGLEGVGGFYGKGAALAEGQLYSGDPGFYRTRLNRIATLTPAEVRTAMQAWLTRPAYDLAVVPGERTFDGASLGGWSADATNVPLPASVDVSLASNDNSAPRIAPDVAPVPALDFPDIERAELSNGIAVTLAQRSTVPTVTLALTLDAGSVVDSLDEAGLHEMMVDMLEQGTTTRGPIDLVIAQEELGSSISPWTGVDGSGIFLTSLTSNLPRSLDIMSDMTMNPLFHPQTLERIRGQRMAEIEEERTQPSSMAARAIGPVLYGDENPYAMAATIGDIDAVAQVNRAALMAEHNEWFRPDLASFTVVGDITMAELLPLLETSFGGWKTPDEEASKKELFLPIPIARSRIVVVDRPQSEQSVLLLGRVLPIRGSDGINEALTLANEVIGNGFLSRLNSDLRETRGWTYSVSSFIPHRTGRRALYVSTQVQADRTGESIQVILDQMAAFPDSEPVNAVELQRVTDGNIRGLPNRYETNSQVLAALLLNERLGREETYQEALPDIYRSIDEDEINDAARRYLHPRNMAIVVIGDRSVVDEQLEGLDVRIEYVDANEL